jgi:ankyrin repeat protein
MSVKLIKPIIEAITEGNLKQVVQFLDDHPEAIHIETPFGSWLHVAANRGQLSIVKELVQRGMDVNARGGILGGNPLHAAANGAHYEVVKYLLGVGSEMDVSNSQWNPLFAAVLRDNAEVAQLLIDHGIDTMADYGDGWNAIAFAKEQRAKKCLKLLEKAESNSFDEADQLDGA